MQKGMTKGLCFCIHFCNPKRVWVGGKEQFLMEAFWFGTYPVKRTLLPPAPAVVCLRKALMAPDTCAAHDRNSQDPREPPAAQGRQHGACPSLAPRNTHYNPSHTIRSRWQRGRRLQVMLCSNLVLQLSSCIPG